jgi:integrase
MRLRGSTYWAQWKHCGVPYAVSLGTKIKKDAETQFKAQMVEVRSAIQDGSHDAKFGRQASHATTASTGDVLLSATWNRYAASQCRPDCSPKTLHQYAYMFARFTEWTQAHRPDVLLLSQVDAGVAQDYAAALSIHSAASTFNHHRDLLMTVFRVLLVKPGLIAKNPWEDIERKRSKNCKSRREFTAEEMRRIFVTLEKRIQGRQIVWGKDGIIKEYALCKDEQNLAKEMLTIVLIGCYTGMRLGDCCLLRWEAVDLDRRFINHMPSKTARQSGKTVDIHIHADLLCRLQAVRDEATTGFICPQKAEQYQKNSSDVSKRFSTLFRQCGIQLHWDDTPGRAQVAVGFHSFRYSFVSLCRRGNSPSVAVEELVGHSNAAMTRHYSRAGEEAKAKAVDSLPSFLGSENTVQTDKSVTAEPSCIPDISALPAEDLKRLIEAAAAEMQRRNKAG